MNIFASSPSPAASAFSLDDRRALKMIVESAQILSTAMWLNGVSGPYKITHKHHPCVKFVANNKIAYRWLLDHFTVLLNTYSVRYNKTHKCAALLPILEKGIENIPSILVETFEEYEEQISKPLAFPMSLYDSLEFPNCTTFKQEADTHKAYRKYLNQKWDNDKFPPKWTKTGTPYWRIK